MIKFSYSHVFVYSSEKKVFQYHQPSNFLCFHFMQKLSLSELFLLPSINLLLSMLGACYFKRKSRIMLATRLLMKFD